MRRLPLIVICTAVALLVAACGSAPKTVPDNGVAVVGDKVITKADWDALLGQTKRNFQATKREYPKPGTVDLANLKTNATQFLIQASEFQQEADKLDVETSEKDVDARLDQIKKQYYGNPPGQKPATDAQMEKRYRDALKQQGFSDTEVRAGIKLQLIREAVFKKVTKDVTVTDDAIRAYYKKNQKQYETPAQGDSREVRHILVKKKALAETIYAQLKANPGKFPQLAKKYSTDTSSAANGGKLPPGTGVKGRGLDPAFEKVLFSIKTHVVSKPVKSSFGWHLIEALGPIRPGTPAKPTPLAQVKEAIKQQLLSEKKQKEYDKWQADMKKSYCDRIGYQRGYAPPPGQDPCKTSSTTTGATTSG